jgi:hypothetical protein
MSCEEPYAAWHMHQLGILITIFAMGVGAWYFIRSAVVSGVRAAHRREDGPPRADEPGLDPDPRP